MADKPMRGRCGSHESNCVQLAHFKCDVYRKLIADMFDKYLDKPDKMSPKNAKPASSFNAPDNLNAIQVADLTQSESWTADKDGYIQWSSQTSGDGTWARLVLTINGTIYYQQTQAGLLSSGVYITKTTPVPIKVGDIVSGNIGFAGDVGKIDNSILIFMPAR